MQNIYNNFYHQEELEALGFKHLGSNVKLSRDARVYCPHNISLNDDCRIDDFCILSAGKDGFINIGKYVHVAAGVKLFGSAGITLEDYVGVSINSTILSISDSYSGDNLTNPCVPNEYRLVHSSHIVLEKHVIVGVGCLLLPNSFIREGSIVGANSLVKTELPAWGMYAGTPVKFLKERRKGLLEQEKQHQSKNQC